MSCGRNERVVSVAPINPRVIIMSILLSLVAKTRYLLFSCFSKLTIESLKLHRNERVLIVPFFTKKGSQEISARISVR
jgi:hypothetical protein